jgi:CDP-4-dehydro-6-deoxyglucose reductase
MPQLLSLTRAARLAGLSRGELQDQIRKHRIETFEGKIAVDELVQAYPKINLERDPVLERVSLIKREARPKSHYTDHGLPEPEVMMARLHDFQSLLARTKATLNSTEQLLDEVTQRLEHASRFDDDATLRTEVTALGQRLREALDKAQSQPDRKAELFAKDAILRLVSAGVRVLPSGHEFFVEGKDSLLDAALRAGLHIDYGCSSGNCGTCKIRVTRGKVMKVRDHDFVLSAREQEQGYCLACSNTAVTDLVVEASEALSAADLPRQQIRCVVHRMETVSDDLSLVQVKTPRTQTLRFMAGQRVNVTLEDGHTREMAVASCPCDARNLQFLLRRRSADGFAEALLSGPKEQTVLVEGPQGDFLLEEEAMEPAVFVAVDDGFGPIKSLIEHAIAIDNAARMYLYRIDEIPHGSPLGNLCRSWDDALDNFSYRRLQPGTHPDEALQVIDSLCPSLEKCRLYVAGPSGWVREFTEAALACGAHADFIRADNMDAAI